MPNDFGWPPITPRPAPPTTLWPSRTRPELLVDAWGVMLADPDGNLIGFDTSWGGGGAPLNRMLYASRSETRSL